MGINLWLGLIGINRNDFLSVIQTKEGKETIEWIAYASNAFNALVPFYANIESTPAYLNNTTGNVSTDNFYWSSRLLAAMADASYKQSLIHIERYQNQVAAKAHEVLNTYNARMEKETEEAKKLALRQEANEKMASIVKNLTQDALNKVLFELSCAMKNAYSRSDA